MRLAFRSKVTFHCYCKQSAVCFSVFPLYYSLVPLKFESRLNRTGGSRTPFWGKSLFLSPLAPPSLFIFPILILSYFSFFSLMRSGSENITRCRCLGGNPVSKGFSVYFEPLERQRFWFFMGIQKCPSKPRGATVQDALGLCEGSTDLLISWWT